MFSVGLCGLTCDLMVLFMVSRLRFVLVLFGLIYVAFVVGWIMWFRGCWLLYLFLGLVCRFGWIRLWFAGFIGTLAFMFCVFCGAVVFVVVFVWLFATLNVDLLFRFWLVVWCLFVDCGFCVCADLILVGGVRLLLCLVLR